MNGGHGGPREGAGRKRKVLPAAANNAGGARDRGAVRASLARQYSRKVRRLAPGRIAVAEDS